MNPPQPDKQDRQKAVHFYQWTEDHRMEVICLTVGRSLTMSTSLALVDCVDCLGLLHDPPTSFAGGSGR